MITGTETGEGSGLLVEWGVWEYVGSSAHTGSADEEWEISRRRDQRLREGEREGLMANFAITQYAREMAGI
jgi:hypothetical protein